MAITKQHNKIPHIRLNLRFIVSSLELPLSLTLDDGKFPASIRLKNCINWLDIVAFGQIKIKLPKLFGLRLKHKKTLYEITRLV